MDRPTTPVLQAMDLSINATDEDMTMATPAPAQVATATIHDDGRTLAIQCPGMADMRFSACWLRDNDPRDRDPGNGQKLTNITELPINPRIVGIDGPSAGTIALTFAPDDHVSEFALPALLGARRNPPGAKRTWAGGYFTDGPPSGTWPAVSSDPAALKTWLASIRDHGLAVLTEVPAEAGMVTRVAELFGYVRETNYGRLFEVRAEADPVNLAFTGLALSPHTDNPYRDPVPSIQLLHCLENAAEGGDTILVDGFDAAARLRREAPEAFEILSRTWVTFRYAAGETDLSTRAPMISVDDGDRVIGVRFNNRSLAPLDPPDDRMEGFYQAYRRFAEILFDPAQAVTFKLAPGEMFAVDNRRVLHGRTGFSAAGKRHLQGCYADMDGLLSRLAVLEQSGT